MDEVASWVLISAEEGFISCSKLDLIVKMSDCEIEKVLISIDIQDEGILGIQHCLLSASDTPRVHGKKQDQTTQSTVC